MIERWSLGGQSALAAIADPNLRLKIAPPRVGWEKRYQGLIAVDLRAATALQEAQRFTTNEQVCIALETAAVDEASHPSPEARKLTAIALAKLGLYLGVGKTDPRQPAGRLFAGDAKNDSDLLTALQARGLRFL